MLIDPLLVLSILMGKILSYDNTIMYKSVSACTKMKKMNLFTSVIFLNLIIIWWIASSPLIEQPEQSQASSNYS